MRLNCISKNLRFTFALICQLVWSKNRNKERDSTKQILLSATNPSNCTLMALTIYLETVFGWDKKIDEFILVKGTLRGYDR